MSLLMDALKKAELAKRQGQSEGAGGATEAEAQHGLALEPLADSNPPQSAAAMPVAGNASPAEDLPRLPAQFEDLDAQFLADAKHAAATRSRAANKSVSAPEPRADQLAAAQARAGGAAPVKPRHTPKEQAAPRQSAAQNLFAAKQAAAPPARKTFAVATGIFTILAVCGIGGYFWWELQPQSVAVASRAPLPPAPVSAPAVVPPPVPAAAPTAAPTLAAAAPVAGVPSPARAAAPTPTDKAEDTAAAVTKAPARARRAIAAPPVAPTEPDGPVRVTRAPLKVNPALIRGFDAFNRGELALAQIEYERAQKSDPRNTDALHGLAAIAVRQGRPEQAEWLYRQIAEADPQDTVAIAALINSRGQMDPSTAESRLKSLSAAQPELAAPHFSLGNLYARHGRWNEAQQAYFRAYSAEPDNPDILYNLAISLEHLRQNKLAAQYYSQAIAAAQNRPAGFDLAQAAARLRTLQP